MGKRKAAPPAVVVTWVDAAMSTDPHWQEGQRPTPPKRKGMHVCMTVGWLVHADENWVQLVATLTDGAHAHVTEIPVQMIKSVEALKSAGEMEIG